MSRETLRARLEAATPGPWHEADRGIGWEVHTDGAPGECWGTGPDHSTTHDGQKDTMDSAADAAFIAHARQDVPALLALADAVAHALSPAAEGLGNAIDARQRLSAALAALEALP